LFFLGSFCLWAYLSIYPSVSNFLSLFLHLSVSTFLCPSTIAYPFLPICYPPLGQEGQQLIQEKPELAASVRKKLGEIRQCWAELESTTQAKARQLFEASKADQLVQSFVELDKKLLHMESQLQDVDPGGDLATVNSQLKRLQVWMAWLVQ
jgi:hypothetical protein